MKILIIGGYGVFGGRLCELIQDMSGLTVLVGGRTLGKAEKHCLKVDIGEANFIPVKIDRNNIAPALARFQPDIFIDASGPFQDYGDAPYSVIEAAIKAKVHYLDFADAADFVFGVGQYDKAAKVSGVCIMSGVSSFPVLTAAVLREIQKDMVVTDLSSGIAPSPYAGIGLNVMRAVMSYAGGNVKLTRNGKPHNAKGLAESRRYTIAPPGFLPLKTIHFSLVDVPDLQLIPAQNPDLRNIWMGAGPVPEFLHRTLNILAKFRAWFRLPSFEVFSPFFYWVLNLMKFGEHRGGMYVHAVGTKDGKPTEKSWHLLAEGDDGPYIPSMAIEAILRKWIKGEAPDIGVRAATHALELSDYETLFEARTIYAGFRDGASQSDPVFKQVLGDYFDVLPKQVKSLHSPGERELWQGQATTVGPNNLFGRMAGWMAGVSVKTGESNVAVTIHKFGNTETWTRDFEGQVFKSRLTPGKGRSQYLMLEKFGTISVAMALVKDGVRLRFMPRRWFFFGIPMPKFFLPYGDSFEYEEDGKFWFNVNLNLPLFGRIASYKGWLTKQGH